MLVIIFLSYSFKWLGLSMLSTLIVQIATGIIFYVVMCSIFKLECFNHLLSTIKDFIIRKEVLS